MGASSSSSVDCYLWDFYVSWQLRGNRVSCLCVWSEIPLSECSLEQDCPCQVRRRFHLVNGTHGATFGSCKRIAEPHHVLKACSVDLKSRLSTEHKMLSMKYRWTDHAETAVHPHVQWKVVPDFKASTHSHNVSVGAFLTFRIQNCYTGQWCIADMLYITKFWAPGILDSCFGYHLFLKPKTLL